eukprot:396453_1
MDQDSNLIYIPWISDLHGIKYTKSVWIKHQLSKYFTQNPTAQSEDAKNWINEGNEIYLHKLRDELSFEWNDRTLKNICTNVRKAVRNNSDTQLLKSYKPNAHNITYFAGMIAFYLDSFTLVQCTKILDIVSKNLNMSNDKWGQCILSIASKKSVLQKCDEKYRYRSIQIMKQTMVSSMMYCDSNGQLLTHELINKLTSIKSNVLKMLQENRIKFDNNETILLYDAKYNETIYRIEIKIPPQVKAHILQFWLDNTRIDPSPTNTIIPDHSNKDPSGHKIRAVIRWLKYTLDDFYELWEKKGGGEALCNQLNCKVPSKGTFVNLRPKEIRFERLDDLAVCT